MVLPAAVIVVDAVNPWYAVVDVAKVTVGPVCVCPTGPIAVTAVVSPCVKQVPPSAKQPLVRLTPLPKEEVAPPVTARTPVERLVVVALVEVEFCAVKFCSVLDPVAVRLVVVRVGAVRVVMLPLLAVKILANIFVVVACVVVLRRRFGRKRRTRSWLPV